MEMPTNSVVERPTKRSVRRKRRCSEMREDESPPAQSTNPSPSREVASVGTSNKEQNGRALAERRGTFPHLHNTPELEERASSLLARSATVGANQTRRRVRPPSFVAAAFRFTTPTCIVELQGDSFQPVVSTPPPGTASEETEDGGDSWWFLPRILRKKSSRRILRPPSINVQTPRDVPTTTFFPEYQHTVAYAWPSRSPSSDYYDRNFRASFAAGDCEQGAYLREAAEMDRMLFKAEMDERNWLEASADVDEEERESLASAVTPSTTADQLVVAEVHPEPDSANGRQRHSKLWAERVRPRPQPVQHIDEILGRTILLDDEEDGDSVILECDLEAASPTFSLPSPRPSPSPAFAYRRYHRASFPSASPVSAGGDHSATVSFLCNDHRKTRRRKTAFAILDPLYHFSPANSLLSFDHTPSSWSSSPQLEEESSVQDFFPVATPIGPEREQVLGERLRAIVGQFRARASKARAALRRPPSPDSLSDTGEDDGGPRQAREVAASGGKVTSRRRLLQELVFEDFDAASYASKSDSLGGPGGAWRWSLNRWRRRLRFIDPRGRINIFWLFLQTVVFLYNAWVIPLRFIFPGYQTKENFPFWMMADYAGDMLLLLDVAVYKHR